MTLSESAFRDIHRKERARGVPVSYLKRAVEDRILDFDEAVLGFDEEMAMAEAARCLQCPDPQPCTLSCPAGNDLPAMLWHISHGEFIEAALVLNETSPLIEVCGRVCPNLCQVGCALSTRYGAISIGKLEEFVADEARLAGVLDIEVPETKTGQKVAIVGSGPAGITVAEDLIKQGHEATIFEAWPYAGGVLIYGIPSFKLDKQVVMHKIEDLEKAGVRVVTNTRIGEDVMIDDLLEEYDAVFLGTGAGVEATMNVPGEDLEYVYTATDFLIRANVPSDMLPTGRREKPWVGDRVAVIGGGDTAVDCARSAIRLGAEEVTIIYRRTEAEMPGNKVERHTCLEEGVNIKYLQAPVEYLGDSDGRVRAMNVVCMELGEPDRSGRRRPVPIEGSEFIQEIDTVVLAVGYWPDPLLGEKTDGLATHKWGLIMADEACGATSRPGVFAAGDNVHGPDLVVTAIAAAHTAAENIHRYLMGESIPWAVQVKE
ncbi:MAG: NAD(P)-dependent oxidoreductase [Chloroflexota bacterium]|nr:MAG: NAD(P)-dependent oxidoreductase [Chloroflexota bacterium]